MTNQVICGYCFQPAKLVGGSSIYKHRNDLNDRNFWLCEPCDAYVGCHKDTTIPFGSLANATLRLKRKEAHSYFDPIWEHLIDRYDMSKSQARKQVYSWLANKMQITLKQCHIGKFNYNQCIEVINWCLQYDYT